MTISAVGSASATCPGRRMRWSAARPARATTTAAATTSRACTVIDNPRSPFCGRRRCSRRDGSAVNTRLFRKCLGKPTSTARAGDLASNVRAMARAGHAGLSQDAPPARDAPPPNAARDGPRHDRHSLDTRYIDTLYITELNTSSGVMTTAFDSQAFGRKIHELLLLQELDRAPRHGYQVVLEIEARSGGYFQFSHGTLYPILHRLEKEGLVS